MSFDTVTFLSDYGLVDESVGAIKSVIREHAPHGYVIDLTHDIPPFDVRAASIALVRAADELHRGVVLATVNPTNARSIAVEVGDGESVLVGPDNGLLAPIVALVGGATAAVVLPRNETSTSRTVLAPAVAALCNGAALKDLGEVIDPSELQPGVLAFAAKENGVVSADVFWVDRFGNVQLNASGELIEDWQDKIVIQTTTQKVVARRVAAFSELDEKELGVLIDANQLVLVGVNQGSASDVLQLNANDGVSLRSAIA